MLIIVFFLGLLSCDRRRTDEEIGVIATVNDEILTEQSIIEFIGTDSFTDLPDTEKRERIDDLIKLTLLAQEAERRGVTEEREIRERISIAQKKIKANALLAMIVHDIEVTESEVFNYYQIHKSRFTGEQQEYRVQRIFLENEAVTDSVSTLIINGDITFAEAARRYSQEPAGERNGYIGYLTSDEMEPAVWNSLRNLSQWRFVRIPVSNGFYLIRYTDVRNREAERPFTEVAEQVREELLEEKRRDKVNGLIEELLGQTEIVISG